MFLYVYQKFKTNQEKQISNEVIHALIIFWAMFYGIIKGVN